jgi:hypothetical protein
MKLPRLLLIAGTGRNAGKTTLACKIIQKFSAMRPIVALKISQHKHNTEPGGKIIANSKGLYIEEETNAGTGKDSSRMLAAGAERSFFIISSGEKHLHAIHQIMEITEKDSMLICESGGLRKWVEPGLLILVSSIGQTGEKQAFPEMIKYEHILFRFDGIGFGSEFSRIAIGDSSWKILNDHDPL